jgi:hypothetical protein
VRLVRIPASPGETFCGFILLHKISVGELLAVIQDGFMQKTRVTGRRARCFAARRAGWRGYDGNAVACKQVNQDRAST